MIDTGNNVTSCTYDPYGNMLQVRDALVYLTINPPPAIPDVARKETACL